MIALLLSVSISAQASTYAGQKGLTLDSGVTEMSLTVESVFNLQMQGSVSAQECESCGMAVTADDQWHFKVTDGDGQVHYVECFMCALNLVKWYDVLHIETFCDWYGPNYSITIDSADKGKQVSVNPPSAMFLRTGFCEDNRVAYNQTAAEALAKDFSQFTSLFQQHRWKVEPTKATVFDGVNMRNDMLSRDLRPTLAPIIMAPIIAVLVDVGIAIYIKVRQRRAGQRFFSWFHKNF